MAEKLDIIFSDPQLVAINKPSGLLVHRSQIDRRETRFAVQLLRDQLNQRVYPVHRLDKPTSGIMLFARNPQIARCLGEAFASHRIQKIYWAVVRGWPEPAGEVDYPLVDGPLWGSKTVQNNSALARPARTGYRVLAMSELDLPVGRYPQSRYALVEASPATGRRHQIRRHFKHIYHPLIGDTRYGEGRHNRMFREQFASHRLLLHARSLSFDHPQTGATLNLVAPLPEDFQRVLIEADLLSSRETIDY